MASTRSGSASASSAARRKPCIPGHPAKRNYVLEYADAINSGQVVACRRIRRWYSKIADRIRRGHYKQWHFDLDRASRPVEFIEQFCKRSDGKHFGEPIQLDIWQKAFIQTLFGFVDDAGNRQFQEVLLLVARKNGKTTLLSCLALYMLVGDKEGAPEIYTVATKLDQARLCYNSTCRMLSQSKALLKHLKKRKSDIYYPATFGYIMPLCSDSDGLDGLNSHFVIIDELHAIKDFNLYEVLKQSISARDQPIVCMITTAGTVRENIFDRMYKTATEIADEIIENDRFLPLMYELDDPDEWTDPNCWAKANPGLGTVKKLSYLQGMVNDAHNDEGLKRGVKCKDFNIRETSTDAWLSFDVINNPATFDISILKNCYGAGGVDLSATTDLTCATLIVRQRGIIYALQHYWIPSMVAEKKIREDKVPYDLWRDQGLMTFCDGAAVDYHDITKWFVEMRDTYGIYPIAIGYDPAYAMYWKDEMATAGFTLDIVRQGAMTMSGPMKRLEADLTAKTLNYNNNPVLKWNLSNTVKKSDDNGNIRPIKGTNPKKRVDGTFSLIDAYVVFERNEQSLTNMENWQDWKE